MKYNFYIFKIKTYIFFLKLYFIKTYNGLRKKILDRVDIQYFREIATSRKSITRTIGTQTIDSTETGEQRKQDKGVTPESKGISLDQSWLAI